MEGRGIVVCGGGPKYLPCVWVCVHMLRRNGSALPIQVWYLGPKEAPPLKVKAALEDMNVEFVDAYKVRQEHPSRILNGWELKCYSIMWSPFDEVFLIDSDNVPLINVDHMFKWDQYQQHGAVFWPDYGRLAPERDIWGITGIEYRDEPEFESGQILVDKRRCWNELRTTMHINEYSDFYYRHVHGDKETFHLAWRKRGTEYGMPPYAIKSLPATMCQHDFHGNIIFQHRNMDKWKVGGRRRINGFQRENECYEILDEFARLWEPVTTFNNAKEKMLYDRIVKTRTFDYHRIDHDRRMITLSSNGVITEGSADMEAFWCVRTESGEPALYIMDTKKETTCKLKEDGSILKGRWLKHEKMEIELTPVRASRFARPPNPKAKGRASKRRAALRRVR